MPTLDNKLDLINAAFDKALTGIQANNPRNAWKDQSGFNLVSLGDWLGLCDRLDISCVPAVRLGSATVDALIAFDTQPDHPELTALAKAINDAHRPATVLRWDMCAPADVKANLATGDAAWKPIYAQAPQIDDFRAFDLIYEYPGHEIAVWQRPWLTFASHAGYPVEYRAFVHDGHLVGVASYYPQRPLEATDAVRADVRQAAAYTRRMADALPTPVRYPGAAAGRWSADKRSFTADFARLDGGSLLYLEGGPPYGAGAHPCCFPPDPADWDTHPDFLLDGDVPVQLKPHPKAVLRPE